MKNRIVLFVAGCIALFLSSCLNSDEQEYDIPKDCQITAFSLSSDSVPGLSAVKFVIDQVNGRIFNPDSMPYGTEIEKVVCTVSRANGLYSIEVTQEALPDSTYFWNTKDSLDFSKPVKFVTMAYDMITKKTYTAQVNIHQQVPDSMSWELLNSNLPGFPAKEQKVVTWGGKEMTSPIICIRNRRMQAMDIPCMSLLFQTRTVGRSLLWKVCRQVKPVCPR